MLSETLSASPSRKVWCLVCDELAWCAKHVAEKGTFRRCVRRDNLHFDGGEHGANLDGWNVELALGTQATGDAAEKAHPPSPALPLAV